MSDAGNREARRLFERLRDGDTEARDQLVQMHLGIAYSIAGRYTGGVESTEDLRQVAALALVKAVDRFDPEREGTFASYAVPTILGELKRHFRDHAWTLHVGRATKELVLRIRQTRAELEADGLPITVPALAERLNVDSEQILDALQASEAQYAQSYDAPAGDDDGDGPAFAIERRMSTIEPGYRSVEDRDAFERASSGLDKRSRLVLELYFDQELSQQQIAERLGVSQMQVSRILRKSLDQVREQLGDGQ